MKIPEDAIVAIAYVFERANGNILGEYEQSEIEFYELNDCDPELLANELRIAISDETECEIGYRAQAYWALGKRFDRGLIPFFRKRLAIELQHDLDTAFQIMIALDNLKEPIFSADRNGSYSILETDLNQRDAKSYLSQIRDGSE